MNPEDKIARADRILREVNKDFATTAEVAKMVSALIKEVRDALLGTQAELKANYATVATQAAKKLLDDNTRNINALKNDLEASITDLEALLSKNSKLKTDEWYKALNNAIYTLDKQIKSILPFNPHQLEDKWTLVVHEINAKLDAIKPFLLVGQDIVDAINDMPIDDTKKKIGIEHIEGIEKMQKNIKEISLRPSGGNFGVKGIDLSVGGTSYGQAQYINLIAGTNLTFTVTKVGLRTDILMDATGGGGSGFTKLTTAVVPNNVIVDFTFASKPLYIIADGAWYQENKGWTWNGGTSTATMTVPPNGDIYGFA